MERYGADENVWKMCLGRWNDGLAGTRDATEGPIRRCITLRIKVNFLVFS